ncbi:hypothetical protein, partial [Micrococcus sp. F3Y]|uniref:hypothetical protein n=1 Tax=Micrococcus sp. F3Y TaxID=3402627 RepID=UPI003AF86FFE
HRPGVGGHGGGGAHHGHHGPARRDRLASTAAGAPKHLCQGFYRGRREGDDAPALAAFSTEGGTGQDFIVATLDGWKFTEVWRGAATTPAGWGVRNPIGSGTLLDTSRLRWLL